jgi:hypothetical protein
MVGYPIYTVPHPRAEAVLDQVLIMENFDHFMAVRRERLAAFRAWLQQHFGVAAPLDGHGLKAVNAWVQRYGGGLVPDVDAMENAYANYRSAWNGPFSGCNVMLDLAIFVGEYLISQRPRLRWICSLDCLKFFKREEISNFGRPRVGGFPLELWTVDVFQMGMGCLIDANIRLRGRGERLLLRRHIMIESLTKRCRQAVNAADEPEDGAPIRPWGIK